MFLSYCLLTQTTKRNFVYLYVNVILICVDRQEFLLEEDEFNRSLVYTFNYPVLSTLKYT